MKKSIYLFGLATTMWFSPSTAQENKNIPANVKSSFEKSYPNIKDAKWNKEEGVYEAKFTDNGTKMAVHINKSGEITAKEYYMKVSDLPQKAQDYLKKNYAGADFNEVSKIESTKGKINYEAETKGKEILFDDKGNFIKVEKEKDED